MSQIIRALGYTGTRQTFTVPTGAGFNGAITAYLWGGGGGGGGGDAGNRGGYGGGGGFSQYNFLASPGDVIEISVGGGGGGGFSSRGSAPGGSAGLSLVVDSVFNSLTPPSGTVYKVSNGAYCSFLNTYGVWGDPGGSAGSFDQTYTVNFPTTGAYSFTGSVDNYGYVYVDGNLVLSIGGYTTTYTATVNVTAGNHSVRLVGTNTGGPGSFGLLIGGGAAFNGGVGGSAGGSGSSGGGGGGGGATVLRVNNSVVAVAAGGGGGAGAGINGGGGQPGDAPGASGQAAVGINQGGNGGTRVGDGGGGGAGGGGYGGGNGGLAAPADNWGYAGAPGGSFGNQIANPSGTNPGGTGNAYYPGGPGRGGTYGVNGTNGTQGAPGYAVIVFDITGTFVKNGGAWQTVKTTYVKQTGAWKPVKGTYIKQNGIWQPIEGVFAPTFTSASGNFGYSSR